MTSIAWTGPRYVLGLADILVFQIQTLCATTTNSANSVNGANILYFFVGSSILLEFLVLKSTFAVLRIECGLK